MSSRVRVGKKTRFDVFKRDGFTCVYCGGQPPKVILHCDHVIAVANSGTNDIDNLVTACDACNLGKGAGELTAVPLTIEQRTALLREHEDQIAAFNVLITEKLRRIEETAWVVANAMQQAWGGDPGRFRRDWFSGIERFVELLPLDELIESVQISTAKVRYSESRCFKYFCGICWNKIRRAS